MNVKNSKKFKKYAKEARLLTVEELMTVGITPAYDFEGIGFVDVANKKLVNKMKNMVKITQLLHFHTYHEGDNHPYFNDRAGLVNRIGYGLAYGREATGLYA